MKSTGLRAVTMQRWQRLAIREQRLLLILSVFILGVVAFSLIWQPTQQRLATAERQYQQQLAVAAQLLQARPGNSASEPTDRALSLRISESVGISGLEMHQMDTDNDLLRLTLSGDAKALLSWLDRMEREGVTLQLLTLERRDAALHAQITLK
ncbi:type II secretion system protein GspM [Pseudomonas putida]|uniref:type II secretion system protein GspM n=1 Tax=Pseudomonas putida TaxID=303 RepID=UPI003D95D69E